MDKKKKGILASASSARANNNKLSSNYPSLSLTTTGEHRFSHLKKVLFVCKLQDSSTQDYPI